MVCYRKSVVNQTDNFTAVIMLKDLEKKGLVKEVEQNIWIRMQTGEELHVHSQCHRTVVHTFSLWVICTDHFYTTDQNAYFLCAVLDLRLETAEE